MMSDDDDDDDDNRGLWVRTMHVDASSTLHQQVVHSSQSMANAKPNFRKYWCSSIRRYSSHGHCFNKVYVRLLPMGANEMANGKCAS